MAVDPVQRLEHAPVSLPGQVAQGPRRRMPALWSVAQAGGVLIAVGLIVAGYTNAGRVPVLFWQGFVLAAPLLFLVAPRVWRNVCPLATMNQLPRRLGVTATRRLPPRLQRAAPLVSAALLLASVELRPAALDRSPQALSTFVLLLLGLALGGGVLFGGKSGWCASFCPMLTVERVYGSSPFVVARHAHCRPCVGCVRACQDAQPTAVLKSLQRDSRGSTSQVAVAGALPWLCIGFFIQPTNAGTIGGVVLHAAWLPALVALGAALSLAVRRWARVKAYRVVAVNAAAALQIYYWCGLPRALRAFGIDTPVPARLCFQALVLVLVLVWLRVAWRRDRAAVGYRSGGVAVRSAQGDPRCA